MTIKNIMTTLGGFRQLNIVLSREEAFEHHDWYVFGNIFLKHSFFRITLQKQFSIFAMPLMNHDKILNFKFKLGLVLTLKYYLDIILKKR